MRIALFASLLGHRLFLLAVLGAPLCPYGNVKNVTVLIFGSERCLDGNGKPLDYIGLPSAIRIEELDYTEWDASRTGGGNGTVEISMPKETDDSVTADHGDEDSIHLHQKTEFVTLILEAISKLGSEQIRRLIELAQQLVVGRLGEDNRKSTSLTTGAQYTSVVTTTATTTQKSTDSMLWWSTMNTIKNSVLSSSGSGTTTMSSGTEIADEGANEEIMGIQRTNLDSIRSIHKSKPMEHYFRRFQNL